MSEALHVVSFVGYKHVGKTTLIAKLTAKYASRGLRVGTVKHDFHGFSGSPKYTDTATFAEAGATSIVVADQRGHYTVERFDQQTPSLDHLFLLLGEMDIVFVEGFKRESFPKWIIFGEELHGEEAYEIPDYFHDAMHGSEILGIIVPRPPLAVVNLDLPVYDRNNIDAISFRIDQLLFTK